MATTAKSFLYKSERILYCADFKDSACMCNRLNYMSEVTLKKVGQELLQTYFDSYTLDPETLFVVSFS